MKSDDVIGSSVAPLLVFRQRVVGREERVADGHGGHRSVRPVDLFARVVLIIKKWF